MSTALHHVIGSELDHLLPHHDAVAEGKRGSICLYDPNPRQGCPRKERGAAGNGAQPGSHLPPSALGYLWPPVNVYKAGPASSLSVQRPDPFPALPGILFPAGRGKVGGGWQGGKTGLPAASVTLSAPPAISGAASPRRAQVRRGELLGPRQHLRLQAAPARRSRGKKGIFRAVDLTPAEFPLLRGWGSGRGQERKPQGELLLCFLCLIGPRSLPTTPTYGRYFLASHQFTLTVLPPGGTYPAAKIFVCLQCVEKHLYC